MSLRNAAGKVKPRSVLSYAMETQDATAREGRVARVATLTRALTNYKLPTTLNSTWRLLLQKAGLLRFLARTVENRGVAIFPEVMSTDRKVLRFLEILADRLTEAFPATADESGVCGPNAIPRNFYALRNVAGYVMNPTSIPPVDNAMIREDLGLLDKFHSPRHQAIFNELIKQMFGRASPASVPIRRSASTGSPDYVDDVPKKKRELRLALTNLDDFLALVDRGNLSGLYQKYNATIVQSLGIRLQPDSVTKDENGRFTTKSREVNDELAARSSFKEGRRFAADKTVCIDGQKVPGHFAMRRRTVYGMSFVANYVVSAHCACWRQVYLEEYAFTWKHRTAVSILEKMQLFKHQVGVDVKQFDQSVGSFLIDAFLEQLAKYVDRRFVELLRLMFHAPFISPAPSVGAPSDDERINPFFGTDPFDVKSFTMNLGLPSGIGINPDFGKFIMTFQYLCLLDDYYHDVMEVGLPTILTGHHTKYALLDMSDDGVILTNDAHFAAFVAEGNYPSKYFKLELESPVSFLGNVPYRKEDGSLGLAPDLVSFFVNWWVPEKGVDHPSRRQFWAIGDRERRAHYAKCPSYSAAFKIYTELFYEHFGVHPESIAQKYYPEQKAFSALSYIDQLVMMRPELLLYKYDENQVSQKVLDYVQVSLPAAEVWPLIKDSFRPTY